MNAATLSSVTAEAPQSEKPTPSQVKSNRNHQVHPNRDENPASAKPAKNRRQIFKRAMMTVVALVVLLATTKFAYEWWTVGRFIQSTDDAYVGGDVTVIAPKVAGFITQIAVTDNQQVHAGDLLIKLDDRDYRAALTKAEADVDIQKAALTNLDATRHLQEAVIAQAQADLAAADAEISRTHNDQMRYKTLSETGAVSIQEFQKADADYKEAAAAGQRCQAALAAAQRQLNVIATQKQQIQAALEAASATRNLARLNLSYTELRAPIDGVVGNRSAQVGAYATTGSQLISLVPVHGLWIDANFKESQLAKVHPGSPATVKIDMLDGKSFPAHVVSIAPATGAEFSVLPPENATGNFTKIVQRVTVRIALNDETSALGKLRPGLSVTANVDTRSTQKAGL